jgi:hypothetical protein
MPIVGSCADSSLSAPMRWMVDTELGVRSSNSKGTRGLLWIGDRLMARETGWFLQPVEITPGERDGPLLEGGTDRSGIREGLSTVCVLMTFVGRGWAMSHYCFADPFLFIHAWLLEADNRKPTLCQQEDDAGTDSAGGHGVVIPTGYSSHV